MSKLNPVCISRYICNHLLGEHHTTAHRATVGSVIMLIGVTSVKLTANIEYTIIHIIVDIVGYGLHAIGMILIIEHLTKSSSSD
jgi:hypothetical protein